LSLSDIVSSTGAESVNCISVLVLGVAIDLVVKSRQRCLNRNGRGIDEGSNDVHKGKSMQRRKERGNDGREVKGKRGDSAPGEITRGRGELPQEDEIQEQNEANEAAGDFKNDRRERRRDRHE
jgi:hypothetical protein